MWGLNSVGSLVTAGQREREGELAYRLAESWGCSVGLLPELCVADALAIRDERVLGVLEFKDRTKYKAEQCDPVWVSERKVLAVELLAHGFALSGADCKPLFVVEFADRLGYVDVSGIADCEVREQGRHDRGRGEADVEPVYEVPLDRFVWVSMEVRDGAEDGGAGQGAG